MGLCRAYQVTDREACLDLLQRGHDRRFSSARFDWLHENGPAGPSHKVVFEADGQVMGLYAVLPRRAWLDGRAVVAGRDVDPVVDPAWRGKGVFGQMLTWMLANAAGIDVFYNFANKASAPGFIKHGWSVADTLIDHVVQTGYRRLISREALLWAAGKFAFAPRAPRNVRELTADAIALLPDPVRPPGRRFAVQRSAAYFAWRYLRSPLHEYRFLARYDGADVLDVLVVRQEPELRRAILVDIAVYRPDGGAIAAYLPYIRRTCGEGWVALWSTVPAAWRRGFIRNPRARGLSLLVRSASGRDDGGPALSRGDCFVTHGDVEAN